MGGSKCVFPDTHWSLISTLKKHEDPEWRSRFNNLAGLYWKPIYAYIRQSWPRLGSEEAKDLTQEFFLEVLKGGLLESTSRGAQSRFRTFLKTCLENFLRKQRRDARRLKRGGGQALLSLDAGSGEPFVVPSPEMGPEDLMDRQWRAAVLEQAVDRLHALYQEEGRPVYFEVFRRYMLEEGPEQRPTHQALADQLGLNKTDIDNYLRHARQRLQQALREVLSETVSSPEGLEKELAALFSGPGV